MRSSEWVSESGKPQSRKSAVQIEFCQITFQPPPRPLPHSCKRILWGYYYRWKVVISYYIWIFKYLKGPEGVFISTSQTEYSGNMLWSNKCNQCITMSMLWKRGLKWPSLTNYFSADFQRKWTKFWWMVYKHQKKWKSNLFVKYLEKILSK